MGVNSTLILEYRSSGFGNGNVFLHGKYGKCTDIYYGPAARTIYDALKDWCPQRGRGSGEYYEQDISNGKQYRERV